jgi:hypothetical protein
MGEWHPDVLGDGFEQQTLPLGDDAEGEVVATVVRSRPHPGARLFGELRDTDVLYVHGWSDYFFQTRLAGFFSDRTVTITRIDGALHDVFLSAPASRDAAYAALEDGLRALR